jgi:hypothetical protein
MFSRSTEEQRPVRMVLVSSVKRPLGSMTMSGMWVASS